MDDQAQREADDAARNAWSTGEILEQLQAMKQAHAQKMLARLEEAYSTCKQQVLMWIHQKADVAGWAIADRELWDIMNDFSSSLIPPEDLNKEVTNLFVLYTLRRLFEAGLVEFEGNKIRSIA